MKLKPFIFKCLVFFFFVAFISSCTVDEYEFTDESIEMELEMYSDSLEIVKRTRVDDKDGD